MTGALQCPICRQVPEFWNARRTTEKRGVRCDFFIGCVHVERLIGRNVIEAPQAEETVLRWNAEVERLFAEHTANWTDGQRATYRSQLGWGAVPQ